MKIINLGTSSSGNAFIVHGSTSRLLLECGFRYNLLLEKSGFDLPDNCLLTHEHGDHSKAVKKYIRQGGKVWTSQGTQEALGIETNTAKHNEYIEIDGFLVLPFNAEHDCAEPLGYLMQDLKTKEALLFATDTYFLRYKFPDEMLTHILIECNFDRETLSPDVNDLHLERVFESHMSLQDLKLMLKANDLSKVESIFLCHMSGDNLMPEKARKEIKALTGKPVYLCLKNGGLR